MVRSSAAFALASLAGIAPALAIDHVVPIGYENLAGGVGFLGPLANSPRTYQLVIHSDELAPLAGMSLTGLSWRLLPSATSPWPTADATAGTYDIYLSAGVPPASRSLTFANNIAGAPTQVRAGSLTIGSYPSGGSPTAFGPTIQFDQPWAYSGGHVLLELRHTAFSGTSSSVDALGTAATGYGSGFSACWTGSYTGTSGSQGNFAVVRFASSPIDPVATGACCFSDGTCTGGLTFAACEAQAGVWRGDGSLCATANCPQPGACCAPDGTCSSVLAFLCNASTGSVWYGAGTPCASVSCVGACCVGVGTCSLLSPNDCAAQSGLYWGNGTVCAAVSCDFFAEAEPNSNKAEATPITLANNEGLRGRSTGTSTTAGSTLDTTVDYFRLKTAAAPLGVYHHRMTLRSATPGHSTWVRGLTQSAAAAGPWPGPIGNATATESLAQAHLVSGTDRVNSWYGFGRQEEVYYRVAGTTATTADYTATVQTTPVTPTSLGTLNAGMIIVDTSGQGHNNDTSLRVYDANLDPIPGSANDDASFDGGAPVSLTTTSFLRREYPAGTYYLAISSSALATNQGAPCDDNGRTGAMMDFPNVAVDTGTGTFTDLSFAITDSAGMQAVPGSRGGRGEIAWFTFTVTGTVGSGGCCFADGTCSVLSAFACASQDGAYRGDGTSCTPTCPQPPTGACCLPGGPCMVAWQGACTAQGGLYAGDNTACATANCGNVVVPSTSATAEGASNSNLPFTVTNQFVNYQQVYAASDFSSLSGPHMIRAVHFRPNATTAAPAWQTTFNLDLRLSTTTAAPDSLSTTFANNVGPDEAVVYSGPATLSTNQATPFSAGPAQFDVVITFQTPFLYDPAGGNLLLHATVTGSTIGTSRLLDAVAATGDPVSRLSSTTVGSATGAASTNGLVTRFLVEPAGTPCYANCDESTTAPILNVADFGCFLTKYAAGDPYANCDDSTQPPVLNVADFGCFLTKYAAGCP